MPENNEKLKKDFDELSRKVLELERKMLDHKHYGYDGTPVLDGLIAIKPQNFFSIGNSYQSNITINRGLSSEANRYLLTVGNDNVLGFGDTTSNSQITLENQPGTTGSTNQSFYYGFRPPLWTKAGISITSGTNTFTDSSRNWTTNSLANAYVDVYDSAGTFKETRKISSNTATVVTVDSNFTYTDANSTYIIFMPIYLGSADYPWRRLYVTDDIRFGRGTSAGTDVIFIKFGSGSPESVVTANVGSLYLRTNGGASTTLYVKESGSGNTGWVAK